VYYGFKSFTPEDYWQYFRARGVSAVVRLNKQARPSHDLTWAHASTCVAGHCFALSQSSAAWVRAWQSAPDPRDKPCVAAACACNLADRQALSRHERLPRAAQMYEGRRFVAGGFRQHELYFPDGSCPSEAILQRFLAIVEAEPGAPPPSPGFRLGWA
jgi:hypothetical protein